jgi:membrane associated rhomboid family serine protease
MLGRQRSGSVVCRTCGRLVGVNDPRCYSCGAANPALWGFAPLLRRLGQDLGFVPLMMTACVGLYAATLLADPAGIRNSGLLSFLSPSPASLYLFGASGALPVFGYHRWWTVLSAGWLHGGLLHILFNLLWVRQLAPVTAELYGAGRMVIIYTVASVAGFALSTAAVLFGPLQHLLGGGAGITIGASAAIFGLLGAMVHYGRRGGSKAMSQQVWGWAAMLFLFGFFIRGVDNWAHLGGFGGGWLVSRWLDPLKPERLDHLVGALVCLLLSAAAVAASVLTALPLGR